MFSLSPIQASLWGTVALLLILTGCASTPARQPLPAEYTLQAEIPGIPEARFWGDEWPTFAAKRFEEFTDADFRVDFDGSYDKQHNYLAICGGGAKGAFCSGLLIGWKTSGESPVLRLVTGFSTGGLTAPFAFLGPEFD